METPIFPKEWLDLRLEFTEEYLLDRKRRKQMQEFKNREIKKINDEILLKRPTPIEPVSILKNKQDNYHETIESYNRFCLEKKKCIIM